MKRPIVVAEIGLNHCGEVWIAKTMMAMAASLGVDYVKFQKRNVDKCYKPGYLAKRKITKYGTTVRDEKIGFEFGKEQYDEIDKFAKSVGIGWYASPFTADDVGFLMQYKPAFMKIASQCINNQSLLDALKGSGVDLVLSTGAAHAEDITWVREYFGPQLKHLMHCALTYPTDDKDMNLQAIKTLHDMFPDVGIGLSSHSQKIIYPVAAAVMGASILEFHITLDRNWDGPDHAASIGPIGLERIMSHLKSIEDGWGNGEISPLKEALSKANNYAWR